LETAIFEIVLRELAETGYVNFSIERVAARAGTSKPVIYRRWPTRARLVYAALRANRPVFSSEAPDTEPSGAISWSFCTAFQKWWTN
jgi:AcrR family transcriptional regulator